MPVSFHVNGRVFQARVFLFDKDGTLIAFDHWFSVMAERARRLAQALGLSSSQAESLAKFMGVKRERPGDWGIITLPRSEAEEATAQYLAQTLRIPWEKALSAVKRVFSEVDQEFPFHKYIRPTPGAEEALLQIKRAGGKVGVVTHDFHEPARLHFRALGWEELIDAIVGLDLCPAKKPAPEPVKKACEFLGSNPKEAVMIGDTVSDLQAGRAAGCQATFGVLTGLGLPEELGPYADALLTHLGELEIG